MLCIETSMLLYFIGLLTIILAVRYHWNRRHLYICASKFPGPVSLPIVGNIACLIGLDTYTLLKGLDFLMTLYPSPGRLWMGSQLFIYVHNPEDLEIILNDPKLSHKGDLYDVMKPAIGNGLVSGSGPTWKLHRKYITQTMNTKMLEKSITLFHEQSKILLDILDQKKEKTFNCNHYLENCASDIILESIVGVKANAQSGGSEHLLEEVKLLYKFIYERMLQPWYHEDFVYHLSNDYRRFSKAVGTFHSFLNDLIGKKTVEVIEKRGDDSDMGKNTKKWTTIEQLILLNTNGEFTDSDLIHEMATLYVAGQDTLATISSWLYLMLAMHPDVQDKVYNEICEVVDGRMDSDLEFDDYPKLKYLDLVIKEVVRLFPIAPFMVRKVLEDTQLTNPNHIMPKGSQVVMSTWRLHRNPLYWEKPNEFIPERFLPEACKDRHPFAYIPFSSGLRSCIGQKYANLGLKTIMYCTIRKYKIETKLKYDQLDIRTDITIRSNSGCDVNFVQR